MKNLFAFIGMWVVCTLVLALIFGSPSSTKEDSAIKEKIEIIAIAEKSDDAIVRRQAEVAKAELAEIQERKQEVIAKEKSKQDQAQAQAQAVNPTLSASEKARKERENTIHKFMTYALGLFGVMAIVLFAMRALKS